MRKLELVNGLTIKPLKMADYGMCTSHEGKMEGIVSCNSGCNFNSFCQRQQKIGGNCICSECFAQAKFNRYGKKWKAEDTKYALSTESLCSRIYEWDEIPFMDAKLIQNVYGVARIESFGELNDIQDGGLYQACNYIQIIAKNPHINWGWWSKRPEIIDKALKHLEINPDDLSVNFIYSNKWINGVMNNGRKFDVEKILEKFPFIKGVFTVYNAEYALSHGVNINCGGRKCLNCLNCYNLHEGVFYINEIVKLEQAKYYRSI